MALIPHVAPKKIIFAFRLSNKRLYIYFDYSKQTVDQFLGNPAYILIKNDRIYARRYINPTKKILLSNVCLIIPHESLENVLKEKLRT